MSDDEVRRERREALTINNIKVRATSHSRWSLSQGITPESQLLHDP